MRKHIPVHTTVYYPVGLDRKQFEALCAANNISAGHCYLFFTRIYHILLKEAQKTHTWVTPSIFSQIHSDEVEKLLGKGRYPEYLDFLIQNDIIEQTGYLNDNENGYCKRYRFTDRLFPNFSRNQKKFRKIRFDSRTTANSQKCFFRHLEKQNLERLKAKSEVKYQLAINARDNFYLDMDSEAAKYHIQKLQVRQKTNFSQLKQYDESTVYEKLMLIAEGRLQQFHTDDYGRFYTHWTDLAVKCHPLVKIRGYEKEWVWDVDICNSQPFFFSLVNHQFIAQYFPDWQQYTSQCKFSGPSWDDFRKESNAGTVYNTFAKALALSLGKHWKLIFQEEEEASYSQKSSCHPTSIANWKTRHQKWIRKGKTRKMPEYPKAPQMPPNYLALEDRKVAKFIMMRPLFGPGKDKYCQVFAECWPEVWRDIKTIKGQRWHCNPNTKPPYVNVSFMLTMIESELLIERMCKWMIDTHGFNRFTTRHDSFLVPESKVEWFANEVKCWFVNEIGVEPPQMKATFETKNLKL